MTILFPPIRVDRPFLAVRAEQKVFALPLSLHLYYNRFRVKYKRILCRFCYFCVISQDLSLPFGSFAQKNALFRQGVFVLTRRNRSVLSNSECGILRRTDSDRRAFRPASIPTGEHSDRRAFAGQGSGRVSGSDAGRCRLSAATMSDTEIRI